MRLRDFATDECHMQWTLTWPQRCTASRGNQREKKFTGIPSYKMDSSGIYIKKKKKSFLTGSLKRKDWTDKICSKEQLWIRQILTKSHCFAFLRTKWQRDKVHLWRYIKRWINQKSLRLPRHWE